MTLSQAQRLWALDQSLCRALLTELVAGRFLRVTNDGSYVRLA